MKQHIITFIILLICYSSAYSQKEVVMSQYMYNKYSINPAFGGSHDVLSVFGSYRKQWIGFENSPTGSFFTAHTPLKNEKIALGLQFFNESYTITKNAGFNLSYTYKLLLQNKSTLAFGVSGGLINYQSNWNEVRLVDPDPNVFGSTENSSTPWIGFGSAIYNNNYFAGFSIPSFMHNDRYVTGENSINFSKIDYLLTGGYLFKVSDQISIQSSALLRLNMDDETYFDISATSILLNSLFVGASYRTTKEIIGILGYQVTPQLRCTYSLDYNIDPIGSYNNGTHEVSLQFDFGYKINSPNPKFF